MINNFSMYNALLFLTFSAFSLNAHSTDESVNSVIIAFERASGIKEIYLKKPYSPAHIKELSEKIYALEKARLQKEGYTTFAISCALADTTALLIKNIDGLISELRNRHTALKPLDEELFEQTEIISKDELLTLIRTTISELGKLKSYVQTYVNNLKESKASAEKKREEQKKRDELREKERKAQKKQKEQEEDDRRAKQERKREKEEENQRREQEAQRKRAQDEQRARNEREQRAEKNTTSSR